jgi:anti-sigma regulatory factor (Ser/Thr protein kinase)
VRASFVGDTLETTPTLLRHEGVPYSGPAALVPTASAMLAHGLRNGDACMVLADTAKLHALRDSLGPTARGTTFFDMSVHGRNPARVVPALQAFVDTHPDRHLRVVAEPVPPALPPAARAEAELNELIFGLPSCRAWQATVSCLYDTTTLDPAVAGSLEAMHRSRPAGENAEALLVAGFGAALGASPPDARRMSADLTTLGDLRYAVGHLGERAGLDAERIDDLVYAVNEIVTNSICHGEGRARVLVWFDSDGVWCEVHDRGRIHDPLVGRIAPRAGQLSGRGLWLVNQLCDLVQVRSSAAGTFVRMFVEI